MIHGSNAIINATRIQMSSLRLLLVCSGDGVVFSGMVLVKLSLLTQAVNVSSVEIGTFRDLNKSLTV